MLAKHHQHDVLCALYVFEGGTKVDYMRISLAAFPCEIWNHGEGVTGCFWKEVFFHVAGKVHSEMFRRTSARPRRLVSPELEMVLDFDFSMFPLIILEDGMVAHGLRQYTLLHARLRVSIRLPF